MVLLGVLARLDISQRDDVLRALDDHSGVSTFSVEEEERVGILIEDSSIYLAHRILTTHVNRLPGVLGTWPIFTDLGEDHDSPPEGFEYANEPHEPLREGGGDGNLTP